MGRQRNNPQLKWKEKPSGRVLNEIDARQLWDTKFKKVVIRKLNELSVSYQKLQGIYEKHTANYIRMKKDIETIKKSQEEMKYKIS